MNERCDLPSSNRTRDVREAMFSGVLSVCWHACKAHELPVNEPVPFRRGPSQIIEVAEMEKRLLRMMIRAGKVAEYGG
jgi:hypothetical protein